MASVPFSSDFDREFATIRQAGTERHNRASSLWLQIPNAASLEPCPSNSLIVGRIRDRRQPLISPSCSKGREYHIEMADLGIEPLPEPREEGGIHWCSDIIGLEVLPDLVLVKVSGEYVVTRKCQRRGNHPGGGRDKLETPVCFREVATGGVLAQFPQPLKMFVHVRSLTTHRGMWKDVRRPTRDAPPSARAGRGNCRSRSAAGPPRWRRRATLRNAPWVGGRLPHGGSRSRRARPQDRPAR